METPCCIPGLMSRVAQHLLTCGSVIATFFFRRFSASGNRKNPEMMGNDYDYVTRSTGFLQTWVDFNFPTGPTSPFNQGMDDKLRDMHRSPPGHGFMALFWTKPLAAPGPPPNCSRTSGGEPRHGALWMESSSSQSSMQLPGALVCFVAWLRPPELGALALVGSFLQFSVGSTSRIVVGQKYMSKHVKACQSHLKSIPTYRVGGFRETKKTISDGPWIP